MPEQDNVSVGTNEPPPESPGQTDGALSPPDKGRSNSSASSLRESDAREGSCSASSNSGRRRQPRTKFSDEQLLELEGSFQRRPYLTPCEMRQLSKVLNLNPRTIRIWFQNRRNKFLNQWKRDKGWRADSKTAAPDASPDFNYKVASYPPNSVLQIHPASQSPACLMPPPLPLLPPVRSSTDFKLFPAFAFPPYLFPDPGNCLIQDFGGLGYLPPPPHSFKDTQE